MITVGMDYEVREGKERAFEEKFARIVEALQGTEGHVATSLYQKVADRRSYLVISEWHSEEAFRAFIASPAFRRTTEWGAENILAARPRHQVYGGGSGGPPAG